MEAQLTGSLRRPGSNDGEFCAPAPSAREQKPSAQAALDAQDAPRKSSSAFTAVHRQAFEKSLPHGDRLIPCRHGWRAETCLLSIRSDPVKIYSEDSGLIYIICALAAPFYYAGTIGTNEEEINSSLRFFNAGKGWAGTAMQYVFSNFGNPGIESLMTEILLHEYYLRIGDHAKGFLISGLIARHVQVLQLNVEHDYDVLCQKSKISWATKESRRRLVWTCYLLDAFIECGIDQLRFISSDDIQVQLPCSEDLFVRNIPCITEVLPRGKLLPFVDPSLGNGAADNLDMRAFYIRAMVIRSKILRYVKHLEGEVPWASSEGVQFHRLNDELRALEDSIPDSLKMSSENTYLFKASGRLNLYFGLHILIAQTYNDLYRVGVSQLVFPNTATKWIRENAPKEFIKLCHRMCVSKALYIASLLKDLWQCHKPSIIDIPFAVHTHICSSVLVTSFVSWAESEPLLPQLSHWDYQEILRNNVRILRYLQRYIKADLYYESANQALRRFNKLISQEETERRTNSLIEASTNDSPDNPPQFSLEYILNPLGTYPMARKQVYDRQKPEVSGTEELAASGLVDLSNPGLPSAEVANTDSFLNPDDIFLGHMFNWVSEIPIMDGMGYPTFLEQFHQGSSDGNF
ncbi:hypothetical protein V502_00723 [Pseudogymnoascus sp. VKM F-4520 (FW-2644)]|nr:hypothetical protein V502_00723 [Pseudogymnoascus sp. VKM F-4520 (FW-2644)]